MLQQVSAAATTAAASGELSSRARFLLAAYSVILALASLYLGIGDPICIDDCSSYTALMGKIPLSADWSHALYRAYGPYTVPVVFSLFGEHSARAELLIVWFQALLSTIGWLLAAAALASLARSRAARVAAFLLLSLCMLGRGWPHANQYLLSDSLSMALTCLWLAATARFDLAIAWARAAAAGAPRARRWRAAWFGYACVAALASGARDSNALMMVIVAAFFALRILHMSRAAAAGLFGICALLVVQVQATSTARLWVNMSHVVAYFVLPDPPVREWFAAAGAIDPSLLANSAYAESLDFHGLDATGKRHGLNELIRRSRAIREVTTPALLNRQKAAWASYLLLHPAWAAGHLLQDRNLTVAWRFNDLDEYPAGYGRPQIHAPIRMPAAPGWISVLDDLPPSAVLLLCAVLLALAPVLRRTEVDLCLAGLALIAGGASNILLAYHGDAWELTEMGRHCYAGSVLLHFGLGLLLAAALGDAAYRIRRAAASSRPA